MANQQAWATTTHRPGKGWSKGVELGPKKDLSGMRFGRWTVLRYAGRRFNPNGSSVMLWECECDCGIVKTIPYGSIYGRESPSCGCRMKEVARETGKNNAGHHNGMYGRRNELAPNWSGGNSRAKHRDHDKYEYRVWRSEVLRRDNGTCQVCGKSGPRIAAHHILGYVEFPEHRYDPENGIALCPTCHNYARIPITDELAIDRGE